MSKRVRGRSSTKTPATAVPPRRILLDVGGTKFATSLMTVERSTYLSALVEMTDWKAAPEHVIFVDRDPSLFAHLLRLMRQVPLVAGLLPRDNHSLFAALLAEADFFGFEALLRHVKAQAYFHARKAEEDFPSIHSFEPEGYGSLAFGSSAWRQGLRQMKSQLEGAKKKVNDKFSRKDEDYGARRFDVVYGSIAEALASEILPMCYYSPPKVESKIIQLLPVEATTWYDETLHCAAPLDPLSSCC